MKRFIATIDEELSDKKKNINRAKQHLIDHLRRTRMSVKYGSPSSRQKMFWNDHEKILRNDIERAKKGEQIDEDTEEKRTIFKRHELPANRHQPNAFFDKHDISYVNVHGKTHHTDLTSIPTMSSGHNHKPAANDNKEVHRRLKLIQGHKKDRLGSPGRIKVKKKMQDLHLVRGLDKSGDHYKGVYHKKSVSEDSPTNSAGAGQVAGIGIGPKGEPGRSHSHIMRRSKFAGMDVFEVSPEYFYQARLGKKKYAKYSDYVGHDYTGKLIRDYGRHWSTKRNPIILKNTSTGEMTYLKYGKQ